jgi:ABC-type Fe3+/spermidine/putrescine transport system ATPase subunit
LAFLELVQLTKSFGRQPVLKSIDLAIDAGSFTMLVGPSGCGKTTTLRLLAGFERPDGGRIELDGEVISDPKGVRAPNLRQMAMVFQSYATWPHLAVRENISFGLQARRVPSAEADKRTKWAAELLGLDLLLARYPHELSGGQQQRVSLARALVTEPKILLLDEPLSNLDGPMRSTMRVDLRRVQRETGVTFVYVTHDQEEAMSMADEVVVLREGSVEQVGMPSTVYREPASSFVAQFIGRANVIPCRIAKASEGTICIEGWPPLRGTVVGDASDGQAAVAAIRRESIHIVTSSDEIATATVREVLYFGSFVEVLLTSTAGFSLSSVVPATSCQVGESVSVKFDPKDLRIYPAGSSGD